MTAWQKTHMFHKQLKASKDACSPCTWPTSATCVCSTYSKIDAVCACLSWIGVPLAIDRWCSDVYLPLSMLHASHQAAWNLLRKGAVRMVGSGMDEEEVDVDVVERQVVPRTR